MTRAQTTPDIYTRVTDTIVAELEKGVRPWAQNWTSNSRFVLPKRANGIAYRGINIVLLWVSAFKGGYQADRWMTYKQAQEQGAQVRKGEKGTTIVYADSLTKQETDDQGKEITREIHYLKAYTVFNIEQIDGLPEGERQPPAIVSDVYPIPALEAFVNNTGAVIRQVDTPSPYYSSSLDTIAIPPIGSFHDREGYYCTLAHELIHWTMHETRLNRSFADGKTFTKEAYAKEELVAELGAAFLAATLNITPTVREDHAQYLNHWLGMLKADKRAIFQAASHAQRAAEYLLECGKECP
jgi:antirestriction protein ArdC